MGFDEIFYRRRHLLGVHQFVPPRVAGFFVVEMFADADGVSLAAFISHDENRKDRRFEFLGKYRRPLREREYPIHKEHRYAREGSAL